MWWKCRNWQNRDFVNSDISNSWILDFVNLVCTGFVYNPVYKLITLYGNCQNWRFCSKSSILLIFVNFDKFGNFWAGWWSGIVYFESIISLGWCSEGGSILRSRFVKIWYLILSMFVPFEVTLDVRFVLKSWAAHVDGHRLIVDSKWAILDLGVLRNWSKLINFDQISCIFANFVIFCYFL